MKFRNVAIVVVVSLAGCYYTPQRRGEKADSSYLSEAEAEELIGKMMAPYGIKFVANMKLKREGVAFVADGYDPDIRVGFEYRSHEDGDFEADGRDQGPGLSDAECATLKKRQEPFREYFLIVPEGTRQQVEQQTEQFIKNLYAWEVLKKAKSNNKKELFPENTSNAKDMLPWESTKDVHKKRLDMEQHEKARQAEGYQDEDEASWQEEQDDDAGSGDDFWKDEGKGGGGSEEKLPDPAEPEEKKGEESVDDDDFDF